MPQADVAPAALAAPAAVVTRRKKIRVSKVYKLEQARKPVVLIIVLDSHKNLKKSK